MNRDTQKLSKISGDAITASLSLHKHYVAKDTLSRAYSDVTVNKLKRQTFNRYLMDWKKEGLIYAAGRGWYSDIPEEFVLTEPLTELNAFLAKAFPLLTFVC